MRYNRADLTSTIHTARQMAQRTQIAWYIEALAGGYGILQRPSPPGFHKAHYRVQPDGTVTLVPVTDTV